MIIIDKNKTVNHIISSYLPIMPRISLDKRELVVLLSRKGKSQNEIGSLLRISRRSVQYILKKSKMHGSIDDRPRSGRPRILSKRMERRMIITSKMNPNLTTNLLKNKLFVDNSVSVDTVKRTLYDGTGYLDGLPSENLFCLKRTSSLVRSGVDNVFLGIMIDGAQSFFLMSASLS